MFAPLFLGRSNCPRLREGQMSRGGGGGRVSEGQIFVPVISMAKSVCGFVLPNSEILSLASKTVGNPIWLVLEVDIGSKPNCR